MTFNKQLADQVLAQIEAHPETWDQTDWRTQRDCGTAYCFAGWAVEMSGRQYAVSVNCDCCNSAVVALPDEAYAEPLSDFCDCDHGGEDVNVVTTYEAAHRALGLKAGTRGLFNGGNSLADLHRIVNLLAEEDS